MNKFYALALCVVTVLVSCGPDTFGGETPPSISKVIVTSTPAVSTTSSGSALTLLASVSGSGKFNEAVTWSITSPTSNGGKLSDTSSNPVTYTAPVVSAPVSVTIRATSSVDGTKFSDFTVTITPPSTLVPHHPAGGSYGRA